MRSIMRLVAPHIAWDDSLYKNKVGIRGDIPRRKPSFPHVQDGRSFESVARDTVQLDAQPRLERNNALNSKRCIKSKTWNQGSPKI